MSAAASPSDTGAEVVERQVAAWRAMGAGERLRLADRMTADVTALAVGAIRRQMPGASDEEVRHELARRRYGRALADAAFGARDQR